MSNPRDRWIATYAVVIFVAVVIIAMTVHGTFEEMFFTRTQVYGDFVGNPLNAEEKMLIQVKIRSSTFSANTRMQAEVIISLNGNYRNWQDWQTNTPDFPDAYQVLFLGTTCDGIEQGRLPSLCSEWIPRLASDQRFYYNTTTLIYSRGGQFDVILGATGNSTDQRAGDGFIEISSTEALYERLSFKMTFIIGVIAAAFAFLSVYEQHRASNRGRPSNRERSFWDFFGND